jgi:hypothetical protein
MICQIDLTVEQGQQQHLDSSIGLTNACTRSKLKWLPILLSVTNLITATSSI